MWRLPGRREKDFLPPGRCSRSSEGTSVEAFRMFRLMYRGYAAAVN